jgi:NADPH2:quinone reductase
MHFGHVFSLVHLLHLGEVVQVGDGVNNFKVGDRVMANLGMKLGGHAQFIAIPEDSAIVRIPDRLSFNEAAALIFGGTTSLFFLKNCAKIQPGEKLLVIGAGGAVGSSAIQIGKALGAKVTAICSSEKFDAVRRLGIDSLFDYKKTDWRTSPERYDVIFDTVGGTNYENCKNHLNPNGRLLLAVADLPLMLNSAWHSVFSSIKIYAGSGKENSQDLKILCDLWSQGTLRPLIGQTFPLEKIADAHRVVETGHKLGSIVVEI